MPRTRDASVVFVAVMPPTSKPPAETGERTLTEVREIEPVDGKTVAIRYAGTVKLLAAAGALHRIEAL